MGEARNDRLRWALSFLAAFAVLLQAFGPMLPMAPGKLGERDSTLAFVLTLSPHVLCLSDSEGPTEDPEHPAKHSNECGICYSLHLIGPALIPAIMMAGPLTWHVTPAKFFYVTSQLATLVSAASYPRAPPAFD
tara:strand:+ start:2455 stop:2856 length:402 start_codon:yes stop_codon:yes gene_type:complete